MNKWGIGVATAAVAGVASFLVFPSDWLLPAFGAGIAVALVSAIGARVDTEPRHPVDPLVELLLSTVDLPPDPLAEIPAGWPLWSLAVSATYVLSLGMCFMAGANA